MQFDIPVDSTDKRKSRPPPRFTSVSVRSSVKTEPNRPSSLSTRKEASNILPSSICLFLCLFLVEDAPLARTISNPLFTDSATIYTKDNCVEEVRYEEWSEF